MKTRREKETERAPCALFNDPSLTLNGLPALLSLSSSFFLSDFISWPFSGPVSCFQITLLPKGRALLYHLPLFIPLLSPVSCPHGDQSLPSVLSSQAPPSPLLFFSFPSSCLQRPDPSLGPSAVPPPTPPPKKRERKVGRKLSY